MHLPFAQWRAELESELAAFQAELVEAVAERDAALIASREAVAAKVSIARAFAVIPAQRLAGPLVIRRRGWEQEQDRTAGVLAGATNRVTTLMRQIADHTQALEHLHTISPQPDDEVSNAAD
jgi:hypothetical protein